MGVHKVSAFHPFIFQKSGKSTIIRNLAVPRHFVAYLVFISSIRVGPRTKGPTSLLALKMRTPVANTGKLRSIGQVPVRTSTKLAFNVCTVLSPTIKDSILFSRNFPVDVIGDIKVFLASFNFKYSRPLYRPCLLILPVKMIHRDGKLKKR